ncbi:MAG: XRE family transcriptional regulator [Lentisphaeria bacterium]|nr:XRE family transcriptional regulator [Lentisphaeria bacterium]
MKSELFDELKAGLEEAEQHARGKITLKSTTVAIPPPPGDVLPADIVRLRRRIGASQAVFARMLGIARDTEISWEQGRRRPSGPARRLLKIAERKPEILFEA